jgi:CBS domain-containing protein
MLVERLLPVAHERLITIKEDAAVIEAAGHLSAPHTYLLVVCDRAGKAVGVMSKLDVVKHISRCSGLACTIAVSGVMTRNVISCRPNDWLRDVWGVMKDRYLHCIPVLGVDTKPLGTLYARDVLQALLTEVEDEEVLLRDYVMSVGFH